MNTKQRIAFYDFDGTLTSGDIVRRYTYFMWRDPSRLRAAIKFTKLLVSIPSWLRLESRSRRKFNIEFFREYQGMHKDFLQGHSRQLFEEEIMPSIFPDARKLLTEDIIRGYMPVMVSGELDFALERVSPYLGFQALICNHLVFKDGLATGEVESPLIAEEEKVQAMENLCREYETDLKHAKAYSDSISDLPMLEAVGTPIAVNPDRKLRRVALQRGWTILNLKRGIDDKRSRDA